MSDNIKILKPATKGESTRDPLTREFLPAEGKAVVMNKYWSRRLLDGSVTEVKLSPAVEPKAMEEVKNDKKKTQAQE